MIDLPAGFCVLLPHVVRVLDEFVQHRACHQQETIEGLAPLVALVRPAQRPHLAVWYSSRLVEFLLGEKSREWRPLQFLARWYAQYD
jgi:hypothetical protein